MSARPARLTLPITLGLLLLVPGLCAGTPPLPNQPDWYHEYTQHQAEFGAAVDGGDFNGDGYDDVLVGCRLCDGAWPHAYSQGAGLCFHGGPDGLPAAENWLVHSGQEYAELGGAIACAGDVNGDGYDDAIVGAKYYQQGSDYEDEAEGAAFVYLGGPDGLDTSWCWRGEGNQHYAFFGEAVAGAGDVDGDGYDDVIVGVPYYDTSVIRGGRAVVYYGDAAGISSRTPWIADGDSGGGFGEAVAGAGDVNGDGYDDVLVGQRSFYDDGQTLGRVYLFLGGPAGLEATPTWWAQGVEDMGDFGYAVAGARDLNRDGYADILVGQPFITAADYDLDVLSGRVLLYLGGPYGPGPGDQPTWSVSQPPGQRGFGCALAGVEDVTGDGWPDILVGWSDYGNDEALEGAVLLYPGGPDGPATVPAWTFESDEVQTYLGQAVAAAGDVDGNGAQEIVIGHSRHDVPMYGAAVGQALVFSGMPLPTSAAAAPSALSLLRNWPNPFNPTTEISFALAEEGDVRMGIHDVAGRLVASFPARRYPAGVHTTTWDGRDDSGRELPSGIYLCRIAAGEHTLTHAMALIR